MGANHSMNNQSNWLQRDSSVFPFQPPEAGVKLLMTFWFISSAPQNHPHHSRARSARSPSPSGMADGQAPLEPDPLLAASRRQRRELVNLPIIAALKGTVQPLGGSGGSAVRHFSPSNYCNWRPRPARKQLFFNGSSEAALCFLSEGRSLTSRGAERQSGGVVVTQSIASPGRTLPREKRICETFSP